jgi:hypothetical protein
MLFRSQAAQKDRTELVVMITPEILPRLSNGVTGTLPRVPETFLPALELKKSIEAPPPAFPRPTGAAQSTTPATQTAAKPVAQTAPQTAPLDPAGAAAVVQALNPSPHAPVVNTGTLPSHPIAQSPAPGQTRALTPDEQAMLDRARKSEQAKNASDKNRTTEKHDDKAERAKAAADAKEAAKQAEVDRKKAEAEQKRVNEAQKRQAAIDKAAADTAGKRAEEQAKKQAEIDKKNQKAVAESQAKLKAAQAAYEAEVARSKKQ